MSDQSSAADKAPIVAALESLGLANSSDSYLVPLSLMYRRCRFQDSNPVGMTCL